MTTLLQATKNDLEFYFCFIGDAWIRKQGAFSRFPCLWLYQSVRFRLNRTPAEEVLTAKLENCEEFAKKLPDKWNTTICENGCALSGGERQRLFIVLALIPNPQVVFLDELTTGLDARARRDVWKILKELKEGGLTIFLTSHFMDEVEALCDEICILKKGRAVFYGTVAQARKKSGCGNFEDAYLKLSGEGME